MPPPKLDYESKERSDAPPPPVHFLSRLNPTATPYTVARRAVLYATGATVGWGILLALNIDKPNRPGLAMLIELVVVAIVLGAALEWQVLDGADDDEM